ncbi:cation:proton antiporter regulatory subunit [Nocardioides sp. Kera G14]|uniref:cation:proton antiporter regulatory subunit n=1 Tax=Nocardioides sp. Kera G14 TaxID=2884264 RepID=UPI001D11D076|nr:TrkA C-terminal domain-containing protein [Nocardioides sp. Kera G14]UDY23319.1 potassium transporter TrkA [Nocardioides sp. Kera G14]
MEVEETKLPGVGLRHDFVTASGRRIGVISTKSGSRHLSIYREDDEDAVKASIELDHEEASVLAELLGAPRVIERLAKLAEQVEGIKTAGIPLGASLAGRTLGDAEIRSRTGASIVAILRGDEVTPSPTPDFVFRQGDKVVVVGTEDGVRAASAILEA